MKNSAILYLYNNIKLCIYNYIKLCDYSKRQLLKTKKNKLHGKDSTKILNLKIFISYFLYY